MFRSLEHFCVAADGFRPFLLSFLLALSSLWLFPETSGLQVTAQMCRYYQDRE